MPAGNQKREAIEFGKRVRKQRTKLGWTIERLGEESGLHWTYIGQVERGTRNISLHNIVVIASALGVDPSGFVKGLKL